MSACSCSPSALLRFASPASTGAHSPSADLERAARIRFYHRLGWWLAIAGTAAIVAKLAFDVLR